MKTLRIVIILWLLGATPATAASFGGVEEWYLYPSLQYFTWEEFSNGGRLLKESGVLAGFGAAVHINLLRTESAGDLTLRGRGELFGGVADYDGQTTGGGPGLEELPVKTGTDYFGAKQEADVGWRFPAAPVNMEPFAGLGYRWWLRSIRNSSTHDNSGNLVRVQGYDEWWQTVYARLGVRGSHPVSGELRIFAEGGAKYPLYSRNEADFPGVGTVILEPGGAWSGFAEAGFRYRSFRQSFYYEGFRFSQSPAVRVRKGVGLLQPKSDSDIFGITVGWAFR